MSELLSELLSELTAAIGDPAAPTAAKRERLEELWLGLAAEDHASRCIAAHYIADVQETLTGEVAWDETALRESDGVSDADLRAVHPTLTVAGFLPSLHLNLADGYRRQGRFEDAADRLRSCLEFDFALDGADPAYARTIRAGRDRVAERVAAQDSSATETSKP